MTQERAFNQVGAIAANLGLQDTIVRTVIDQFTLSRADWLPFSHQLQGWVKSSHYGQRASSTKFGKGTA